MERSRLETFFMEAAWEDMRQLTYKAIHRWIKRNGEVAGDFEDLLSYCSWIFMDAWDSHIPGAGSEFSSWLYARYNYKFTDRLRKIKSRDARIKKHQILEDMDFETAKAFDVEDYLETLSSDGQHIIRGLFEDSASLISFVGEKINKTSITKWLKSEGWSWDRIQGTFHEIQTT